MEINVRQDLKSRMGNWRKFRANQWTNLRKLCTKHDSILFMLSSSRRLSQRSFEGWIFCRGFKAALRKISIKKVEQGPSPLYHLLCGGSFDRTFGKETKFRTSDNRRVIKWNTRCFDVIKLLFDLDSGWKRMVSKTAEVSSHHHQFCCKDKQRDIIPELKMVLYLFFPDVRVLFLDGNLILDSKCNLKAGSFHDTMIG